MTYASVRSAAEHIARVGAITPHQLAAFSALDQGLTDLQRQGFTELWRAEGGPAVKVVDPAWLAPALKIIREFEGCHLQAYLCPAGVWTIGWGATVVTNAPVRAGDKISQPRADELLLAEILRIAQQLHEIMPPMAKWGGAQQAALISWAYNVGLGAVKDSTLRKRINAGEGGPVVIPQELPKWDKANGKPLAGLTRRRAAEVALFTGAKPAQAQQQPAKLSPSSPFTARITPHITLGEFALGQESRRFDHQHQVNTAAELAAFMERCRARFGGKAVIITSGYRPAAINRSVGGASGSEHLYNAPSVGAVDFYIQGESVKTVQDWCDKEWPYSLGYGAPKGFVHLGIRSGRPRVRWDY
jgi:GH24 family phage-related lysozyme (muramidase)